VDSEGGKGSRGPSETRHAFIRSKFSLPTAQKKNRPREGGGGGVQQQRTVVLPGEAILGEETGRGFGAATALEFPNRQKRRLTGVDHKGFRDVHDRPAEHKGGPVRGNERKDYPAVAKRAIRPDRGWKLDLKTSSISRTHNNTTKKEEGERKEEDMGKEGFQGGERKIRLQTGELADYEGKNRGETLGTEGGSRGSGSYVENTNFSAKRHRIPNSSRGKKSGRQKESILQGDQT